MCAASAEVETFTDKQIEDLSLVNLSINKGPLKKLRYSLLESHLRRTIDNLESWHAVFDPSWFLITLHSGDDVDSALETQPILDEDHQNVSAVVAIRNAIQESKANTQSGGSIFREKGYVSQEQHMLPHSNAAIAKLTSKGGREVILDATAYPEDIDKARIVNHVRDLARILSCSQPWTLGLLQCLGVLKIMDSTCTITQFQYIFTFPPEVSQLLEHPTRLGTIARHPSFL